MRPKTLASFFGQKELLNEQSFVRRAIESDTLPSLIFWGPSGSGKTTLAHIIASETKAHFVALPAVGSGVKDLRAVIAVAKERSEKQEKTILFIDEIHRWNKSQQDALLPYVESGLVTLIGATTENPSFEVNGALLSRARVCILQALSEEDIVSILKQALCDTECGLGNTSVKTDDVALHLIARFAGGDGRMALNTLEVCVLQNECVTLDTVKHILQKPHLLYDKNGDQHYDIISALHKSMRGGDANASLYWLVRMLEAGEDPLYIARRLIRFASEDVGLANSFALPQAIAASQACQLIGMPECGVNLAQAVVYLARSKKSNVLYAGYQKVQQDIRDFPNELVPLHLRNAPTKLMKDLGYGRAYKYTPDFADEESAKQDYLPEQLQNKKYIQFEENA